MAIPMKITTNQGIAVRSVPDGAPEAYVDEDGILAYLDDVQGVPFVISGLTPTMSVTGSPEVTYFNRSGTNYTQVLWRQSGGFTLSGNLTTTGISLVGGGGSGGARSNENSGQGGGGGGWADISTAVYLPSGSYTLTIGAGGSPVNGTSGNDGSATNMSGPFSRTASGGGGGGCAVDAVQAVGRNGGNGGGGAGGLSAPFAGGVGSPGFNGGTGFSSSNGRERAGAGGGGASAVGSNGTLGAAGAGGAGVVISWANPVMTVSRGGSGSVANSGSMSPSEINGNGSNGIYVGSSGAGGNGLVVVVFPTANANVTGTFSGSLI